MSEWISLQINRVRAFRLATGGVFDRITDTLSVDIQVPVNTPRVAGESNNSDIHTIYFLPVVTIIFAIPLAYILKFCREPMVDQLREAFSEVEEEFFSGFVPVGNHVQV